MQEPSGTVHDVRARVHMLQGTGVSGKEGPQQLLKTQTDPRRYYLITAHKKLCRPANSNVFA